MIKRFNYIMVETRDGNPAYKPYKVWAKNARAARRQIILQHGVPPVKMEDATPVITCDDMDDLYKLLKLDTKKYQYDFFRRFVFDAIAQIRGTGEDV